MVARGVFASICATLAISALACGTGAADSGGTSARERALAAARQESQSLYEKSIDDTDAGYTRCFDELEATGKCTVTNGATGKSLTIYIGSSSPRDWRDQLRKAREVLTP